MGRLERLLAPSRFLRLVHRVEILLAMVLAVLLLAVTVAGTLQLLVFAVSDLGRSDTPWLASRINALLGDLLTLLIALEVLQNITAFLRRGEAQIQLVLLTAITAVARKVIVLPPGADSKPMLLVGLGAAVLSLSAAYWLVTGPGAAALQPRRGPARSSREPDPSPQADGDSGPG